jgi:hypothetical protein
VYIHENMENGPSDLNIIQHTNRDIVISSISLNHN